MSMDLSQPDRRFSSCAGDYSKYRPDYPVEVMRIFAHRTGLHPVAAIADIGSGTGKLAELFLKGGYEVYAVEPNGEMRARAEDGLSGYRGFRSVSGHAEATGLPAGSMDAVSAGQAFHWFDPEKAKEEFLRILKPKGGVFLIWYDRRTESPFEEEYEQLVERFGTDYRKVNVRDFLRSGKPERFFAPQVPITDSLDVNQSLDLEGLLGRAASSSFLPAEGGRLALPLVEELSALFRRHQVDGQVELRHRLTIYTGTLV